MYKNDALKWLTSEVRLSYIHIDEPYAQDANTEPKYQAAILLPKSEQACYADIMAAIQAAYQQGVQNKWKGAQPQLNDRTTPIHDGDATRASGEPYGEECRGCWVLSAKSKNKPEVVHISNIHSLLPMGSVKSGDYARVMLNFYAYDSNGNRGVACSLGNIMITREGEPLGNRSSASSDFAEFESAGAGFGTSYAPPPQTAYGAPAPPYNAPAQQPYQQNYNAPPVQQPYGAPQQSAYPTPPPQQPYGGYDPYSGQNSGGYPGY